MLAVRFVLWIIPVRFWRVKDNREEKGSLRLTKALFLQKRAKRYLGNWYWIYGYKSVKKNCGL